MNEALSWRDTVETLINCALSEVRTSVPGRVNSYDSSKRTVNVQPAIDRTNRDTGDVVPMAVIKDVPVAFQSADGGRAAITLPIKKGDPCLLIVSDRFMHDWIQTGNRGAPDNKRKHDISDAFAIVGPQPFSEAIEADADALTVRYGNGKYKVESNGTVTMESGATPATINQIVVDPVSNTIKLKLSATGKLAMGSSSAEIVDVISQICLLLANTQVPQAPSGTSPLSTAANFATLNGLISKIKGKL